MPNLIGDDLIVGILHHITDFTGLVPLAYFIQRHTVKEDLTIFLTVRSKNGL